MTAAEHEPAPGDAGSGGARYQDRPAPDPGYPYAAGPADRPCPGYPAYPTDPAWPGSPDEPRRPGRAAAVTVGVVLGVAAFGAPLGLLWATLAPRVLVRMTENGAVLADGQPEQFIAADGWFSLLGFGFGVLAAVAVWLVVRRRGPLPLLAVTLGAVGAGLLAWWLGRRLGLAGYERLLNSAPAGTEFGRPADLRAADADLLLGFLPVVRGDVLVPALAAAVAYTLLAGWSRYSTLRSWSEPDLPAGSFGVPVSWDSTAPPAPPAAPERPAPGAAAPPPG